VARDPILFGRLGIRARRGPEGPLLVEPFAQTCARGVIRSSVLVLAVDMMGGFIAEAGAGTDWIFTTDLSLRTPALPPPARLAARGRLLRAGRGLVHCDVALLDTTTGREFSYGQTGFMRVPRRHGDPEHPHLHEPVELAELPRIERALAEEVGARVIDPARGQVEIEMRDALRNHAGALQGALVALVGELAAEALADSTGGEPCAVTDLDVRYLAMAREGPIWTRAEWLGGIPGDRIRVELRDRGNRDRLVSAVLARVEPAPQEAALTMGRAAV
jgi:acyl-coenzyme A thioesterase PaaI-like protein